MATLAVLMNVYNEARLLPLFKTVLNSVDSAVVIDGGPLGPSTDGTLEILQDYANVYPLKIMRGTFRKKGHGGYDHGAMRNAALAHISTSHFLYQHADIVYEEGALSVIKRAIEARDEKAIYYSDLVEFFIDKRHCNLFHFPAEQQLPRCMSGDSLVYNMAYKPVFLSEVSGVALQSSWNAADTLYVPQVTRYHLALTKPFANQVEKHVRRITQGDWGDLGAALVAEGFGAIFEAALGAVKAYRDRPCFDYCGIYPSQLERYESTAFDGEDAFYRNIEVHKERLRPYYENLA